jgi:1-acyl-sn-glycerol-3-phosphate acyltransferase
VDVYGLENVPKSGALLICTNHLSIVDPGFVFVFSPRKDLSALVAKKHQKNPFLRLIVNTAGGIWLNRDDADTHAIRAAQEILKNGGCLGIAPEGTRSHTHGLIEAKTGAAYLADRAQAPVLPVGIAHSDRIVEDWKRLHRPRITVRFGTPFQLPPVDRKDREAGLRRNTDEIMCQIAALLPEEHWGVYRDHPRLKEVLIEKQAVA